MPKVFLLIRVFWQNAIPKERYFPKSFAWAANAKPWQGVVFYHLNPNDNTLLELPLDTYFKNVLSSKQRFLELQRWYLSVLTLRML